MIKFYADEQCTKPINTIEWDNAPVITLLSGEKMTLPNTAMEGTYAEATVWVRNEWVGKFYVTSISFHDERVTISIGSERLYPNKAVKLTVSFPVPKNPTKGDIIKAGEVKVEGYYVYVE
jgi:hypothetical protein